MDIELAWYNSKTDGILILPENKTKWFFKLLKGNGWILLGEV